MLDFLRAFDSSTAERMERTARENATQAAIYLTFATHPRKPPILARLTHLTD